MLSGVSAELQFSVAVTTTELSFDLCGAWVSKVCLFSISTLSQLRQKPVPQAAPWKVGTLRTHSRFSLIWPKWGAESWGFSPDLAELYWLGRLAAVAEMRWLFCPCQYSCSGLRACLVLIKSLSSVLASRHVSGGTKSWASCSANADIASFTLVSFMAK